jgi:hypothetical protein
MLLGLIAGLLLRFAWAHEPYRRRSLNDLNDLAVNHLAVQHSVAPDRPHSPTRKATFVSLEVAANRLQECRLFGPPCQLLLLGRPKYSRTIHQRASGNLIHPASPIGRCQIAAGAIDMCLELEKKVRASHRDDVRGSCDAFQLDVKRLHLRCIRL